MSQNLSSPAVVSGALRVSIKSIYCYGAALRRNYNSKKEADGPFQTRRTLISIIVIVFLKIKCIRNLEMLIDSIGVHLRNSLITVHWNIELIIEYVLKIFKKCHFFFIKLSNIYSFKMVSVPRIQEGQ